MKRLNYAVSAPAFLLAMFLSVSSLAADDYQGADAILKELNSGKAGAAKTSTTPVGQWIDDVEAYRAKLSSLTPEEAARQWLDLAVRYTSLTAPDLMSLSESDQARITKEAGDSSAGSLLLKSLPGPDAWPALTKLVDARGPQTGARKAAVQGGLELLAHTLIGDAAGQEKALREITAINGLGAQQFIQMLQPIALEEKLALASGDPEKIVAAFRDAMAETKKRTETAVKFGGYIYDQPFQVPDLVTIVGADRATPLLTEAIQLPHTSLQITGMATNALAAKLALEQVANLKQPHWELIHSLDAAPLYEAFEKRFPGSTGGMNPYPKMQAGGYYLLYLITSKQPEKAVQFLDKMKSDTAQNPYTGSTSFSLNIPVDDLEKAGYLQEAHDFLEGLLKAHPELPLWDQYIQVSAKTGQTAQMLDMMRSLMARTDLSDKERRAAHRSFYLALLAADRIDEGVAELRKLIAAGESNDNSLLERYVVLARLGQLLGRNDLLEEGIKGAEEHLTSNTSNEWQNPISSLAELLVETGRGPAAEKVLGQALAIAMNAAQNQNQAQPCLLALARVYYKAGRAQDILTLLENARGWGGRDLSDILTQDSGGYQIAEFSAETAPDDYPIGYMAAWALAQQGEKEHSLRILNALLDQEESFDPGYELLSKLSGQDAIPRLNELARRDRFETRPLIWKAQLQLDAGKLDDAEKTVRAAIAIDPSDGQQGPGRRMRAYAVLAEILDRKGDKDQAKIYHGVIAAIRMSEKADRYYEVGLLTRAVKMYEESLTHFADAYCIQSRLALRLSELGDFAGAEEHYRRAYELMPESFGRVESHCFGCERAFAGARAQSIAERVFTGLAKKEPSKPQVHYLLGYLRMEQQRYGEALQEYEAAVKLDPDYLNAWKQIADMENQIYVPSALSNEVALNEIRLDPLQHHEPSGLAEGTDLKAIWNAVAANAALAPQPPGSLLRLPASASQLDAASASNNNESMTYQTMQPGVKPADVIFTNHFINALSQFFQFLPNYMTE